MKATQGDLVGANWMGKLKFNLQIALVAGILLYLLLDSAGVAVPGGERLVFWAALGVTAVSVALVLHFLRGHWWALWRGNRKDQAVDKGQAR